MVARRTNVRKDTDPEVKELLRRIYGAGDSEGNCKSAKGRKKK